MNSNETQISNPKMNQKITVIIDCPQCDIHNVSDSYENLWGLWFSILSHEREFRFHKLNINGKYPAEFLAKGLGVEI